MKGFFSSSVKTKEQYFLLKALRVAVAETTFHLCSELAGLVLLVISSVDIQCLLHHQVFH